MPTREKQQRDVLLLVVNLLVVLLVLVAVLLVLVLLAVRDCGVHKVLKVIIIYGDFLCVSFSLSPFFTKFLIKIIVKSLHQNREGTKPRVVLSRGVGIVVVVTLWGVGVGVGVERERERERER